MTSDGQEHRVAVDPEVILDEIEQTRSELGRTVEALAAKADVKEQAKEKVAELGDRVAQMSPDDVRSTARSAFESVRELVRKRPAVAYVAGGLLLLWLVRRR